MNTPKRGAVTMTDVAAVYSPAKEKVQSGAAQSRQSGWQFEPDLQQQESER